MAGVKVTFPSLLTSITKGEKEVKVEASTLGEAIDKLVVRYGGEFKDRVLDDEGRPRRLLNFFINGKNARFLKDLETPLKDEDEVFILPAVSGG